MAARLELLSASSGTDATRIMDEMSRLSYLSRAIHVVANLELADHIGKDTLPAAEIAERAGLQATSLERVLRFLSAYGVNFGLNRN